MKKVLTLLVIGIMMASCNKETNTGYVIDGNAEGVHNGIRVRLSIIDNEGKKVVKDSAIVMDEKFTLKGNIEEPSVHFLSIDGNPGNIIFMLENSNIGVNVNKEIPMESKITGSESNKDYEVFQESMMKFNDKAGEIIAAFQELGNELTSKTRDSIAKVMNDLRERQMAFPLSFVKENNEGYFSLNLIELESSRQNIDIPGYMEAFENLIPKLKTSKKGVEVKKKLDILYEKYQKIAHLEVGNIAPNFEAPALNGDMISLENIKGKVTIIDFWAAWCGPCRKENPNVVNVYKKYHKDGLEIIGVSLDGERRQQDPKKSWQEAIEKDGLTWHHVSNLKYFNDPVAKLYNIQSIPATFILDAEGKIVAKNLRGQALEEKIKELLEKS